MHTRHVAYTLLQTFTRMMRMNDINPLTAKLFNLNFHPLEVVDRVTQVSENYSA